MTWNYHFWMKYMYYPGKYNGAGMEGSRIFFHICQKWKLKKNLTVLNWRCLADWIFGLGGLNIVNIFFEAACLADHIDPGVHFFPRVNRQEVTAGPCINAKHEVVVSFSVHQSVLHLEKMTNIYFFHLCRDQGRKWLPKTGWGTLPYAPESEKLVNNAKGNIAKSNKSELWNCLSYRGLPYLFEVRSQTFRNDCKILRSQTQNSILVVIRPQWPRKAQVRI